MAKKVIIQQGYNELIVEHNIARLRGKLTTIQSRSMLSIFKTAYDQILENPKTKVFKMPTGILLNNLGLENDTRGTKSILKDVSSHLDKLMTKIFQWGTQDNISKAVFMQEIELTKETVTFKFSDYIREHIKPLTKALIIKNFDLMLSFKSEYSRQLYKHLMLWDSKGTCKMSLDDFKDFMGISKLKSYSEIDVLKRRVLKVAIKEINEKCPKMDLKYTNLKLDPSKARTITHFNFGWNKKEQKKSDSLFNQEDLKSEYEKYINKFFEYNGILYRILVITPIDNFLKLDTDNGEIRVPNIETLQKLLEDYTTV
jgi:plasmid replication initiation protein